MLELLEGCDPNDWVTHVYIAEYHTEIALMVGKTITPEGAAASGMLQ